MRKPPSYWRTSVECEPGTPQHNYIGIPLTNLCYHLTTNYQLTSYETIILTLNTLAGHIFFTSKNLISQLNDESEGIKIKKCLFVIFFI